MASPTDYSGAGSPEGVITAIVGSTYRRTNGGTSTTFYIKEFGSGPTGWVAAGAAGVGGVSSFAKSGSTPLTGAVTVSGGSNVTLTQTGQDVSIAANAGTSPGFLAVAKWGVN